MIYGRNITGGSATFPGSGAITMTRAPEGPAVTHSAQLHGRIRFTSESGITGTLLIGTGKIRLDP